MLWSEVAAKAVVGNAIAVIAAALLPGAVVRLPVSRPTLLKGALPDATLPL
jgi:hypothetical protein